MHTMTMLLPSRLSAFTSPAFGHARAMPPSCGSRGRCVQH